MGIFDSIKNARIDSIQNQSSFGNSIADIDVSESIPSSLFGERQERIEPILDFDHENGNNSEDKSDSIKDLAYQIGKMLNIGGGNESAPEERANLKGLFSEKYLQNVAALRLSQMKIKYNLKVSVIKMAFGKMLEAVGKDVQAKKVWDTQVTLGNIDDIIQEIIYLDLSHQNKMGTLKPITPDEFFSGLTTMAFEKIGGEGFENYIELAQGGFDKVKSMMKPKQPPQ